MSDYREIIERLERGECSNELDIAIEIELFDPPVSVRPNAAGTKLIYTLRSGKKETFWADDHSMPERRGLALDRLRALESSDD